MSAFDPSPAARKRRFKVRCGETNQLFQNWQIRVHRSLSWSLRAEKLAEAHPEAELLFHWIAFNSLYGSWDAERNAPEVDSKSRNEFLRVFISAGGEPCGVFLGQRKAVLKKLLGSPFLSGVFWRDPNAPRAESLATAELYKIDGMLNNRQYARLFELAFERVFVFRGQLVHGASSGGSSLNRSTLSASLEWMRDAVPLVQHLAIEHGAHNDWPELCYPPIVRS
jgi:hypothetical protein